MRHDVEVVCLGFFVDLIQIGPAIKAAMPVTQDYFVAATPLLPSTAWKSDVQSLTEGNVWQVYPMRDDAFKFLLILARSRLTWNEALASRSLVHAQGDGLAMKF